MMRGLLSIEKRSQLVVKVTSRSLGIQISVLLVIYANILICVPFFFGTMLYKWFPLSAAEEGLLDLSPDLIRDLVAVPFSSS